MKKYILLSLLLAGSTWFVSAQNQRLVLAEEFTNASCGPCAAQNPAFDALLNANPTKITAVKYHTNWPGVDPMNAHNPQDIAARVTYYSVSGVPYCRLDGVAVTGSSYVGAPSNLNQAKIDAEFAITSPLLMQLQANLNPAQDSIFVTLLVHATQAVTGTLVAHIAVIEKHINFVSAPGGNGEKNFSNVVVKLVPGKNGTSIGSSMNAGDYKLLKYAWALPSWIYNKNELAAVAFVQNNANKAVIQAANSSVNAITPVYANDATVTAITNIPKTMCTSSLSPVVTIQNNGTQPLTSLQIAYSVNGGTVSTFAWTGNLNALQSVPVSLPAISFGLNTNNTVTVTLSSPNGQSDNYPANDVATASFQRAPLAAKPLSLRLKTDNNPAQTTWTVKTAAGALIAQGGPYTQALTETIIPIVVPGDDCYVFEMNDAAGNGICCTSGYGYYQLSDSTGNVIAEGDEFGAAVVHAFEVGVSAIQELNPLTQLEVYPNPVQNQLAVKFSLNTPETCEISVFDAMGSRVYSSGNFNGNAGSNLFSFDLGSLSAGMYLLTLKAGSGELSLKLTK